MRIRDIVNREIVNLTNCEHEPIHIPGSIQPHGFLFGFEPQSREIIFCSGNTDRFLNMKPAEILGKRFETLFGDEKRRMVKDFVDSKSPTDQTPLAIELNGNRFQIVIHRNIDGLFVLEAEPDDPHNKVVSDVYRQTAQLVSYMNETSTLKQLCDLVAKGTREITGYDRVMIYRFDEDYNGEVFAESCRSDLEPFLGLHYPHTDIPVQARELYLKNLLRLIVDINYEPVPIFTIDNGTEKNLDLSLSTLRSTSPIHVKYLQNMGVGATLTISLVHRGRLWGLIACHHYSPKILSHENRLAVQLQGQFITSQIDIRQLNEEYEQTRKSNAFLQKLNSYNLPPVLDSFSAISQTQELMKLCNASGVAMVIDGKVFRNGATPKEKDILALGTTLSAYSKDSSVATSKLSTIAPQLHQVHHKFPGVIYHSLTLGNCIIWFRQETITEVRWGGDPNKAIIKDESGLHPRKSFEQWKELVNGRSNAWRQPELNAAANYASLLQKNVGMFMLSREEERFRNLNEVLRETNAELENINWISAHDLQEPLRKIQLMSSRLLDRNAETFSEDVVKSLHRMNVSAAKMQGLLIDILKYTRIQNAEPFSEKVDLNKVFDTVVTDMAELIKQKNATVTRMDLPTIMGVPFLLSQLFTNLINNSLKYSREGVAPIVNIALSDSQLESEPERWVYTLILTDNGIGFNEIYAENIFNMFTRLHSASEYEGSGIGLALCRKIMKAHGGVISATSVVGEGSTFIMKFPWTCSTEGF